MHLPLHLAIATSEHPCIGLLSQVPVVVTFGLRGEETSDAHRDGTGYEFSDSAEDD